MALISHTEPLPQLSFPNWTVTIDSLSDEVLLNIFDHYRESFDNHSSSERDWNKKHGWFKLVHVCKKWRRVVFVSRSRLKPLLFFAESTPTRAAVLDSLLLSQLSISIDYSKVSWTTAAQTRFISALRYPNRVVKIAINGSRRDYVDGLFRALDLPFPILTALELHDVDDNVNPIFEARSLMASITSLQTLCLVKVQLLPLLPLLSITRVLESLNLTVDTILRQVEGASLLTHLRYTPHLREIQVSTQSYLNETPPVTAVLLAELSDFHFSGQRNEIEWFLAGLIITPPLQGLRVSIISESHSTLPKLQIPHLSEFIHTSGIYFDAARLSFSESSVATSMFSPDSSRIVTIKTPSETDIKDALSSMLLEVEDVFLCISVPFHGPLFRGPLFRDPAHWRKFFRVFRNVKVLRLHQELVMDVVNMLQQPRIDPDPTPPLPMVIDDNGHRSIFDPAFDIDLTDLIPDILPSLEKIVVYGKTSDSIGWRESLSTLTQNSFMEYLTGRREMYRPVELVWTDEEIPGLFMQLDVGA